MNTQRNELPKGLYVLRKDKAETLAKVEDLSLLFIRELNDKDAVKKCKEVRHSILLFLKEFFLKTCGIDRSIRFIKGMDADNCVLARKNGERMYWFLIDLKLAVEQSFLLNELPSCRSLLDDSIEVAAQKALDLIKNNIVTGVTRSIFIGKDINDLFSIADLKRFYKDKLDEFSKEKEEGWKLTPVEQMFECKFQVEEKYCELTTLHVAGKLTKELYETEKLWLEERERKIGADGKESVGEYLMKAEDRL